MVNIAKSNNDEEEEDSDDDVINIQAADGRTVFVRTNRLDEMEASAKGISTYLQNTLGKNSSTTPVTLDKAMCEGLAKV